MKTEIDHRFEYKDDPKFARRINIMIGSAFLGGILFGLTLIIISCLISDFVFGHHYIQTIRYIYLK